MKPFYSVSPDDWEYLTNEGFIGIPVYGGIVFRKPGYHSLLVDHEKPEIRQVSDNEIDKLVTLRDIA